MFTGIIQQMGSIKKIDAQENLLVVTIDMGSLAQEINIGDSVAVSGVCLTATAKKGPQVKFDVMRETIEKTALRTLNAGDKVNLELALKPTDRLGGHFVTGHVDEVAVIKEISIEKNWVAIRFSVSPTNARYLAPKGSMTIDGISLTIGKVAHGYVESYLIPHTLKMTTLGFRKKGDSVNLETDILAKYLLNGQRLKVS